MYGRIVVALDGSEAAEGVLPHASALADRFGAELALVHVAARTAPHADDPATSTGGLDRASADRYLKNVADRLGPVGRRARRVVLEGVPSDEIVHYAAATRAHLIVLATRGLGDQARLRLGSVADAVVRAAACPVLLLRVERDSRHGRRCERSAGHGPTDGPPKAHRAAAWSVPRSCRRHGRARRPGTPAGKARERSAPARKAPAAGEAQDQAPAEQCVGRQDRRWNRHGRRTWSATPAAHAGTAAPQAPAELVRRRAGAEISPRREASRASHLVPAAGLGSFGGVAVVAEDVQRHRTDAEARSASVSVAGTAVAAAAGPVGSHGAATTHARTPASTRPDATSAAVTATVGPDR